MIPLDYCRMNGIGLVLQIPEAWHAEKHPGNDPALIAACIGEGHWHTEAAPFNQRHPLKSRAQLLVSYSMSCTYHKL